MTHTTCPKCRRGHLEAFVCYDECNQCGYTVARPGCTLFRYLQNGDQFLAGYDPLSHIDILTKGSPPGWEPEPGAIEPNAYTPSGRLIAFGPEALVRKIN